MTGIEPRQLEVSDVSLGDDYFDWTQATHQDGCKRAPSSWEVRFYRDRGTSFTDRPYPVGLRAYCPACGASYELVAKSGFRDEHGDAYGPSVYQDAVPYRGCHAKPVRVLSHWLHAEGRRLGGLASRSDFSHYYLTGSAAPPTGPEEVLGVVSWAMNRRGNVRWHAGLTRTTGTRFPHLEVPEGDRCEKPFPSPAAAARWIVRTLQDRESSAPST